MSDLDAEHSHLSVLVDEVIELVLKPAGGVYVDATLGLGGHTEAILRANDKAEVIGIDQDTDAIKQAKIRLEQYGQRVKVFHANFSDIREVVAKAGNPALTGVLADLGVSSMQLDSDSRGFSFRFDAPLDMRMDPSSDRPTAAELLATLSQEELANIIYNLGEERHSRKIARWIIERRESGDPIATTEDLANLVRRAVPKGAKDKIHPATRTFQALRIAVNGELDILENFISDSIALLDVGGVLAIITFHSLEDRIVKHAFQRNAGKCQCPPRIPQCVCGAVKRVEILTRKPVLPSEAERDTNPRARSAKLRACQKL